MNNKVIYTSMFGYKDNDALSLADPDNTGGNAAAVAVTVTDITVGPTTDDSLERGISFQYNDGTTAANAKIGYFGMLRSGGATSDGKFKYIPDATYANNTYSGTAGTIIANTEGDLTGDVKAVDGTTLLDSGADLANSHLTVTQITGTLQTGAQTNITSVGTLTAGAITASSAFAINSGTGNITTSGQAIVAIDGATGAAGSLSFGATGGATDAEMYFDATDFNITTGGDVKLTADSLRITPDTSAAVEQELTFFHDLNVADPKFQMGTSATEALDITTTFALKELQSARINTKTVGSTADDGKIEFAIDDIDIFHIGDNGIYGKLSSGGYTWQNDEDTALETFDYPQLDGFYINGGVWTQA